MSNITQINISKLHKIIKYILMGLIVIIATRYIPDNILQTKELIMIGATSSIAFAILDMISPGINIINNEKTKTIIETNPIH